MLEQLRDNLSEITRALFYDEIEFTYDAMGFTMAFSHPAELLGDMCAELDNMLEYGTENAEDLNMILSGMKEMVFSFDLVQLNDSIKLLEAYLAENK